MSIEWEHTTSNDPVADDEPPQTIWRLKIDGIAICTLYEDELDALLDAVAADVLLEEDLSQAEFTV